MKQLKCPNCGAALEVSSPLEYTVECPYCHQQVINDQAHGSGNPELLPRIIHFAKNRDEDYVMKQMVNLILSKYTEDHKWIDWHKKIHRFDYWGLPKDLFDKMSIVSVQRFYVPMYLYENNYSSKHIFASSMGQLLKSLDNYTPIFTPTNYPFFSKDEIKAERDVKVISPNEDADTIWHLFGGDGTSKEYHTYLIYTPLWKIGYSYDGKTYWFTLTQWPERYDLSTPIAVIPYQTLITKKQQALIDEYNSFQKKIYIVHLLIRVVVFFVITTAITCFLINSPEYQWFQRSIPRIVFFYFFDVLLCALLWLIIIKIFLVILVIIEDVFLPKKGVSEEDICQINKQSIFTYIEKSAQEFINRKGWKNNSYSRSSSTHREEKQKKDTNWQHKNEKSNVRSNPDTNNQGMFNQKWVTSIYSSIKQFIKDNISVNVIKWGIILLLAIVGTIAISTIGIIVGNAVIKYVKKQSSSMNSSTAQWEPISNHTENESVEEESEEESVAPETGEEETQEEAEQQDGTGDMIDDNVPVIYGVEGYHRLNGKIDNYMITMEIDISGTTVNGSYYYDRYGSGSRLSLSGKYENGVVDMYETDSNGTITGRFVGVFGEGMIFKGLFVNQQEQQMVFQAKEY